MPVKQADLYYKDAGSDKEYHVQLEQKDDLFVVNFQYGRRGSTLTAGTKTPSAIPLEKADKIYDKLVAEKTGKGYTSGAAGTPYVGTPKAERVTGMVPQLLNPIDEAEVEKYLKDSAWGAQEKKDGKHVMCRNAGGKVTAANRKGLEIGIPEPVVKTLKADFVDMELDGEMIGETYHVFDLLEMHGMSYRDSRYQVRYSAMVVEFQKLDGAVKLVTLATNEDEKRTLYSRLRAENKEGIVFKRLDAPYRPGRPESGGSMLKCKFYATASCIVSEGSRDGKRSVALELLDGNEVTPVGNVTVPPNQPIPKPGDIVEVRYLYAYKGGSLYQPVLLGVRDDIDRADCKVGQLKFKSEED